MDERGQTVQEMLQIDKVKHGEPTVIYVRGKRFVRDPETQGKPKPKKDLYSQPQSKWKKQKYKGAY